MFMSIEAREREIYSEIPSLQKLAEQLQQGSAAGKRKKILTYALLVVGCVLLLFVVITGIAYHLFPLKLPILSVLGTIFGVLAVLTFVVAIVTESFRVVKALLNPAITLDKQIEAEEGLVCKLVGVPADLLLEKRERLNLEITILDRRVKSTRLFGLFVAAIVVAATFFDKGITGRIIQVTGLMLVGLYGGAIALGRGTEALHRVAYVLKKATEQNRGLKPVARSHVL
jgi:hypothetical protein